MKKISALLVLCLTLLTGCDSNEFFIKAMDKLAAQYPTEIDLAKKSLGQLQAHDLTAVENNIAPHLKNRAMHGTLEQMANLFPAGSPTSVKLIGLHYGVFTNPHGTTKTTSISFEYEFPNKWLQADVVLQGESNQLVIEGLHVAPLPDSLENINKFALSGKGMAHYLMLAAVGLVPLFIVVTVVFCIRTRIPKRKWLWVLFVLCGICSMQLNWTDGAFQIMPLSFNLLGAGYARASPYSPLIMTASMPLGAIIFWLRRKKWLVKKAA